MRTNMRSHLETVTVGQRDGGAEGEGAGRGGTRQGGGGGPYRGLGRGPVHLCLSCNDLNNDLPAAVQEHVQYRYRDSLET